MRRESLFSPCGQFRYWLLRVWDDSLPILPWLLCNPSKAGRKDERGEEIEDPTSRKGIGFSERLGCGGMIFVNPWAYCATKFADLRAAGFPIGPDNDRHILEACAMGDGRVICGWGANGRGLERPRRALALVLNAGYQTMALALTKHGDPVHPLMLSYTLKPFRYPRPAASSHEESACK